MHTATAIVCAYASLQDTLQISPFGGGGHERRAFTKSVFCTMYADRMSGGVVGQGCHRASSSTRRPPVASGITHSGTYTVGAQERSYKVHLATKGIQIRFRHHYLTLVTSSASRMDMCSLFFTSYSTEGLGVVAGRFFPSQQDCCSVQIGWKRQRRRRILVVALGIQLGEWFTPMDPRELILWNLWF